MNENKLLNISSSPHVRSRLTTGQVMLDVVLALMPATVFGIIRYGLHAFLVILLSVLTAVLAEYVFDYIAKKPNTVKDGSAVVTRLRRALSLPPAAPRDRTVLGSRFAIQVG
ncbi:MAG: RnfABCDGE type electron transport complex subunit D, partial [Lachnospiraceae bacterium]|nr:RnfABCDGE type electron transport complex subunit D [Lachnospiraceae bacterium]